MSIHLQQAYYFTYRKTAIKRRFPNKRQVSVKRRVSNKRPGLLEIQSCYLLVIVPAMH